MKIRSSFASPRRGIAPILLLALLVGGCASRATGSLDPEATEREVEGVVSQGIEEDTAGEGAPAEDTPAEDTPVEEPAGGGDLWIGDYGYDGGWRVDKHVRDLADVNGDGLLDIVGFNDAGVYVSPSLGHGFMDRELWSSDFGYDAGWRTASHVRVLADVNGDRMADIVGINPDGIWVSRALGTSFTPAERWLESFGQSSGWRADSGTWRVADVNGDGLADIVGIDASGVHLALSTGAAFGAPLLIKGVFSESAGPPGGGVSGAGGTGAGDTGAGGTGVGDAGGGPGGGLGGGLYGLGGGLYGGGLYGSGLGGGLGGGLYGSGLGGGLGGGLYGGLGGGLYGGLGGGLYGGLGGGATGGVSGGGVSGGGVTGGGVTGTGPGAAAVNRLLVDLGDFDGDGDLDLAAFQEEGVFIALYDGETFSPATRWTATFGQTAGIWRPDRHLRLVADVDGDGKSDIVGFHDIGVFVSLSTGTELVNPGMWTPNFGREVGDWRIDKHIRQLFDLNGDRKADIVGFGEAGVWTAMSNGAGFDAPVLQIKDFGAKAGDWSLTRHVRLVGDVIGDHDIAAIAFGDAGVRVRPLF